MQDTKNSQVTINRILSQTTFQAGLVQLRAQRALNAEVIGWLAPFQLTLTEWAFIGLLVTNGPTRPSDLATELQVSAPMVTSIIKKLQRNQLIRRRVEKQDHRSSYAELTVAGEKLAKEIEAVVRSKMHGYLEGVSREHLAGYLAVLDYIASQEKPQA